MKILVDFDGVKGNYTGVPRAVHDDVLSLLTTGIHVTLWMNNYTGGIDDLFEVAPEFLNEYKHLLDIDTSRPKNSNLWFSQINKRKIYKEFDFVLCSLFPALGENYKRIIRMHDPFGHTGSRIRELFYWDGKPKLVLARSFRNYMYINKRKMSLTVPSSKLSVSKITETYSLDSSNVKLVACAVGPRLESNKLSYRTREPYFLFVGGFRQRKRPDLVAEVWAEIFSELGINLIIVGTLPLELLSKRAQKLASLNHLKIINRISTPELRNLQRSALACIFVSMGEGFGRPIAESLYVGTPVIVNNLPVFKEFSPKFVESFEFGDLTGLQNLMVKKSQPISNFETLEIMKYGDRFSYQSIGKSWENILTQV